MPSYLYKGAQEKIWEIIPAGPYIATVTKVAFGYSSGAKTNGSENCKITYAVDDFPNVTLVDTLIFHEVTFWRIDTFAQCFHVGGKPLPKDQPLELNEGNMIGLRGWVLLRVEKYKPEGKPERESNKVDQYRTTEKKLWAERGSRAWITQMSNDTPEAFSDVTSPEDGDDVPF